MLYATVRNRKISVKKPTTIPRGSVNVDKLVIDFDEEWDGFGKRCIFVNAHVTEKKTCKVVTTTTVSSETKESGAATETTQSTETVTEFRDPDTELTKDLDKTETTVETNAPDGDDGPITTTTTTVKVTSDQPVIKAEEAQTSIVVTVDKDNCAKVPWECLVDVGQLSVSIVGSKDNGDLVMTTAAADSFWEVVECGEQNGEEEQEPTPGFLDQVTAVVSEAQEAAKAAKNVADELKRKADNGEFNGKDGKNGVTPSVSIGTVETVAPGETASVTNSGMASNVVLDFKIPRGAPGDNTPVKGVDYWTEADKEEIVARTLAALPNLDEEEF